MNMCPRCGNKFLKREYVFKHLKKQKECQVLYLNIPRETIRKDYNKYYNQYVLNKGLANVCESNDEGLTNVCESNDKCLTKVCESNDKIITNNVCNKCGREFTRRQNLYTHRRKYCKIIKQEQSDYLKFQDEMSKKFEELKKQYEEENEGLKKKITDLVGMVNQKQINNINNGTIDQSNNQTINITLNEYGKESIDHISKKEWLEMLEKRFRAIPELVNKIYIDNPENRTVYIPSQKDNQVMIYKGETWKIRDLAEVLEEIFMANHNRIWDFISQNNIDPVLHHKTDDMLDQVDHDEKKRKKCKGKVKYELMNGKIIVKRSYEEKSGKKLAVGN